LVGCGSVDQGGRHNTPPPPSSSAPSPTVSKSVEQDIDSAVAAVDDYWSTHWQDFFTGTYHSPHILGAYDGASADVPRCGGRPLDDDNAVYCPAGDYLAWD